ncbi:MarR family transcriptional regulator [Roseomonas sp. E05]|uniref:MarR family winged helix-turn-helix transcriptional regulator n=1 Tax=Roseomonas sp. E05 TaxID=3046310 RepID=UPI0024BB78F1|nr:MarR family transcriptional regulator [Roseomonas sp. E05]MDJ0390936.1 MarR family transcriptional regulator [Roseomonas sp. E05]
MVNAKLENIVGALALALSDDLLRQVQDQAPEPGPAAAAIALLRHEPGMAIERLRRALRLSHPGAVRLVDRLVAAALVVRRPGLTDRRAVALHLTEDGEQRCDAILRARRGSMARALGTLDEAERRVLGLLTEKLLAGLIGDVDDAYSVCRLCDTGACRDCPVDRALSGITE